MKITDKIVQDFLNWRSDFKKTLYNFEVFDDKGEIVISYKLHAIKQVITKKIELREVVNFVIRERLKKFRNNDDMDFRDI